MAHIEDADYETLTVTCDHCKVKLLLNRRDDLSDFSAISGRSLICFACDCDFWITGDVVNTAYEMFIFAADGHSESKHYMLAVMSLAQAWEIFLATFAYSNFAYRPFWNEGRQGAALAELNRCQETLGRAIRNFNFRNLLNLTAHTIVRHLHPRTLAESESMIETIERDSLHRDPSEAEISTISDTDVREAVQRLRNLQVAELRNKVGHKEAYRPSADEIVACREEEIIFLHYVRDLFGIGEFDEFGAGVVETPRWFEP
jgi:hypothetical protein